MELQLTGGTDTFHLYMHSCSPPPLPLPPAHSGGRRSMILPQRELQGGGLSGAPQEADSLASLERWLGSRSGLQPWAESLPFHQYLLCRAVLKLSCLYWCCVIPAKLKGLSIQTVKRSLRSAPSLMSLELLRGPQGALETGCGPGDAMNFLCGCGWAAIWHLHSH